MGGRLVWKRVVSLSHIFDLVRGFLAATPPGMCVCVCVCNVYVCICTYTDLVRG
jgi:hypothetical protein